MKLHRSATETRSKQDDSAPGKSAKTRIATQSTEYNDIFRRAYDQPETLNPTEIQILTSRMGNHAIQRLLNGEKTSPYPNAAAMLSRRGQRFVIQRFPDEEAVKTRAYLIKKNKWQEKSGQDDKSDYYQALNEFRRIEQHSQTIYQTEKKGNPQDKGGQDNDWYKAERELFPERFLSEFAPPVPKETEIGSGEILKDETVEATEKKLAELKLFNHIDHRETIVGKIKQFLAAMEKSPVDAYRLQNTLTAAIEGFIKVLSFGDNYITRNQEAEKQAIASLQSWLFQITNMKEMLKSAEGDVVADDKQQGKLIYRPVPPLTVEEGRKTMDELRQGTPPSVTGITLPVQMQQKLAVSNQFEWGLGVIGSGEATEAVIISGSSDATPFSEYPYMKPLAHTHPVKDYVKQPQGYHKLRGVIPAIHRQESCAVSDVLNNDKSVFAVDLLPSKEDVDMTAKRGIPQTVYVNYKYDAASSRIINPDVAAKQPQPINTSHMPWIDFVIGVPRKISEQQEEVVLIMRANGQTVVRWKITKNQSTYWWQNG